MSDERRLTDAELDQLEAMGGRLFLLRVRAVAEIKWLRGLINSEPGMREFLDDEPPIPDASEDPAYVPRKWWRR